MSRSAARRTPTGLVGAVVVTVLLALYGWLLAGRGVMLIRTGRAIGIAFGVAVIVLPLIVAWLVWREFQLATTVQRMADRMAADGDLPVDDLPRSPGGRVDRPSADALFPVYREAVQTSPEDWRAWYNLAFAYDAAHDRKRARASLRRAAALFRASRGAGPIA